MDDVTHPPASGPRWWRLPASPVIWACVRYNEGVRDDHGRIVSLLSERWVFVLSTLESGGQPYSTPLYFALDCDAEVPPEPRQIPRAPRLLFVTDPATFHGQHLGAGPTLVSGATYLESREVGELRGVQLRGIVRHLEPGTPTFEQDRTRYLHAHPVARAPLESATPPRLYALSITWAKYTDYRLGFGTHGEVSYSPHESNAAPVAPGRTSG